MQGEATHTDTIPQLVAPRAGELRIGGGTGFQRESAVQSAVPPGVAPPTSADGIEKYLSSGMIRGVGPVYAKFLPDKRTSFLPNRHCCN
jgi:hypothetical protein